MESGDRTAALQRLRQHAKHIPTDFSRVVVQLQPNKGNPFLDTTDFSRVEVQFQPTGQS